MAEQLVESLAADFDPKKYKDTFREQVLALLERKAEGQEIVAEPAEAEPRGKVVNLMDALANMSQEMIRIELQDTNSSALITVPEQAGFKYVVMPMRI